MIQSTNISYDAVEKSVSLYIRIAYHPTYGHTIIFSDLYKIMKKTFVITMELFDLITIMIYYWLCHFFFNDHREIIRGRCCLFCKFIVNKKVKRNAYIIIILRRQVRENKHFIFTVLGRVIGSLLCENGLHNIIRTRIIIYANEFR